MTARHAKPLQKPKLSANYSEYLQLHKDFTNSYQETEALKSLLDIATERHYDCLRSIAHEFADNSGTSIIHSSGEQTIYDALKSIL